MADHYIGLNRGVDGTKISDFTTGAASTAALDFEFRIADVDDQAVEPKREDAILALKAIIRALEQVNITTFPKI